MILIYVYGFHLLKVAAIIKFLSLTREARKKFASGKINLMSTDAKVLLVVCFLLTFWICMYNLLRNL